MNNSISTEVELFLKAVLLKTSSILDDETIREVNHYIDHAEYEMAFEGLFIEIMNLSEAPELDYDKSEEIAYLLKLNKHSVFDIDFWNKFKKFIIKNCN